MITADTITDEQIHLLHRCGVISARQAACALGISYPTHVDRKPTKSEQATARASCVTLLNGRRS